MSVRPWLIAGTGPSLKQVSPDEYRIVTLNRALAFFPSVVISFLYHSKTVEAMRPFMGRAGYLVVPTPLDSYLDWANGAYREEPINLLPRGYLFEVLLRQIEPQIRCRQFQRVSGLLAPGPCCVGALGYLVKNHDITEIHTVGIDGGTETHPALAEAYSNRNHHPIGSYDRAAKQFGEACDLWGVRWKKL